MLVGSSILPEGIMRIFVKSSLVVAIYFVATLILWSSTEHILSDYPGFIDPCCDPAYYYGIATHRTVSPPFSYRIFTPAIVGNIPGNLDANWALWTFCWTWGYGIALYYLLQQYGIFPPFALVGGILFYFTYTAWYLSENVYMVDMPTFATIALALIAAHRKLGALFIAIIAIGVLNREVALFASVFWFIENPKKPLVGIISIIVSGAILSLLRFVIPVTMPQNIFFTIQFHTEWRLNHISDAIFGIGMAFAPYLILALLNIREFLSVLRKYALFGLFVFIQIFLASEAFRMYSLFVPVMTIAAMRSAQIAYNAYIQKVHTQSAPA